MHSLSFALLACTHASFFDRVRAPPGKIKAVKYVTVPSSLANASDVRVPNLIYASAYKRHQTAELVERAFRAGFRGVDTASGEGNRFNETGASRDNDHYLHIVMRFLGVGEALRNAVASMPLLKPSDGFFVQVKVHHVSAPKKGVEAPSAEEAAQGAADRVTRAVRHGLRAIGIRQAGALLLRGPSNDARRSDVLSPADVAAWRALQGLAEGGVTSLIGVCNFSPKLLEQLLALDGPRCRIHQTKLRADRAWGREDRSFALAHDLLVQAPGLVSGNRPALDRGREVQKIASSHGISPEQATLKFALQLGVVPVVGSTSALHVRDDLAALAAAPFTRAEMDGVEFAYSKGRKPAAPHVKMPHAKSKKHKHKA